MHGQSGMRYPEKLIGYVKEALQCPLDPVKELRLYIYWGDALQIAHRGARGEELAAARREVVVPYLQGLKKALRYDLPETAPDLPGVGRYQVDGPPEVLREFADEHAKQVAARKKAEFQRDMIMHRDVLTSQISFLYSRKPLATDELERLATKHLQDDAAVERLMAQVKAAIEGRTQGVGGVRLPIVRPGAGPEPVVDAPDS